MASRTTKRAPANEGWAEPYFGATHKQPAGAKAPWCTVIAYRTFAILKCWYPGCGFDPLQSVHKNAAAAMAAGDAWLSQKAGAAA